MIGVICLGETYCRRGMPMLKTRIQLPAILDGEPTAWMLSLTELVTQYAEQTLLPAVCKSYDSLHTVAEKMHFEPYDYRQSWQTVPHPGSPALLTVHMETALSHGNVMLCQTKTILSVDGVTGRIVRGDALWEHFFAKKVFPKTPLKKLESIGMKGSGVCSSRWGGQKSEINGDEM